MEVRILPGQPIRETNLRQALTSRAAAPIVALSLALWAACGSGPSNDAGAVYLVDRFDAQSVEGTASLAAMKPSALWEFSAAENPAGRGPNDPLLGWKAGPGITGLKVVDGKLTGRSTTDSSLIYAAVPDTIDAADSFHSIELRIRVDRGESIKANPGAEELDLKTLQPKEWTLAGPLAPGEHFNTAVLKDSRLRTMGDFHTVIINPVDAGDATFAIESIRLISQREHRDKTPSGVGWQGLSGVFHETIVSRSPESFTIEADLPPNARLDLSIGTVQPSPVTFKIEAVSSDGALPLFQRTLTTPHRWEDVPVDLSSFSGTARLRFSLAAGHDSTLGFWGSPAVVSAGAKPRAERTAGEVFGRRGTAPRSHSLRRRYAAQRPLGLPRARARYGAEPHRNGVGRSGLSGYDRPGAVDQSFCPVDPDFALPDFSSRLRYSRPHLRGRHDAGRNLPRRRLRYGFVPLEQFCRNHDQSPPRLRGDARSGGV